VQLDKKNINKVKSSLHNSDALAVSQEAYKKLLQHADSLLVLKNPSVVDKEILPPTQDPHDYLSISRYWWPDASKEDGLPWIRRDGITNPDTQTDKVDRKRLGLFTSSVEHLAYAYFFSSDEKYAEKGVSLIRTWFLDEATRMNPHFSYSQSVPGINKQRRSGILDGRLIPLKVLDSITLFSSSEYWTEDDNIKMNVWLNAYLTWLTESPLGEKGAQQNNNHGSWYYFQVVSLAYYLNRNDILHHALKQVKTKMAQQIDEDGAQAHELKRTKPFFYSSFNLEALTKTAIIADRVGDSLWSYPSQENSLLVKAVEFLLSEIESDRSAEATGKKRDIHYFLPVLARYIEKSNNQQNKDLLNDLLTEYLNNKKQLEYHNNIYMKLALLKPWLLSTN